METKSVEVLLKEKKIYQIVNPKLVQAPPEMTVEQAVNLMCENKAGYIVVAKNKKVVGVFTETDLVNKVLENGIDWKRPLSDFMTREVKTLNIKEPVGHAIDLMGQGGFYHIPLVNDEGQLVNVLSVRTLIRFLAEFYPTEVYNLPPKSNQAMATPEGG